MPNVNTKNTEKHIREVAEQEEIKKENIGRKDLRNDPEYIYLRACNRRLNKTIAETVRFLQKTIIKAN